MKRIFSVFNFLNINCVRKCGLGASGGRRALSESMALFFLLNNCRIHVVYVQVLSVIIIIVEV